MWKNGQGERDIIAADSAPYQDNMARSLWKNELQRTEIQIPPSQENMPSRLREPLCSPEKGEKTKLKQKKKMSPASVVNYKADVDPWKRSLWKNELQRTEIQIPPSQENMPSRLREPLCSPEKGEKTKLKQKKKMSPASVVNYKADVDPWKRSLWKNELQRKELQIPPSQDNMPSRLRKPLCSPEKGEKTKLKQKDKMSPASVVTEQVDVGW
ncbi:uncharacterized protein LOC111231208 [Seriola dumerili]|uniref:uncharacterized protein LOC111231208 n=1 Tax=Seriola dumerili TaxID=41447 RepID=UPI000BBE96F6|nr:uncharacterized protein LOC111231208 [Seriola dumerili]